MLNLLKADSRYHQKKKTESAVIILLAICLIFSFCSCGKKDSADKPSTETAGSFELDKGKDSKTEIDKDGEYTTAKDVAGYIHTYHKLPSNYVTEKEAIKRGWKKNESPDKYGFMIGGRKFRNYEGLLPGGEDYKECDVDYSGKGRGKNRLVYTEDGKVYHSTDHYESFTELY